MAGVLLLNSSYEPLRIISLKRAVILVLQEKADVLSANDEDPVRSEHLWLDRPLVVKLRYYVKIPYRARVALNRKSLTARDGGICQYCGKHGNTIDHVIPRAKGGRHEWENVVLACSPCNQKKSDSLLSEIGWTLPRKPEVPRTSGRIIIGVAKIDEEWAEYLDAYQEPQLAFG